MTTLIVNRPIKFRAWIEADEETEAYMDYDPGIIEVERISQKQILDGHGESKLVTKRTKLSDIFKLNGSAFMQWTGLPDKNGKPMYEGDLIKNINAGEVGEIVWVDCSFEVHMINPTDDMFWDLENHKNWEVIGNVFESPELLKE